MELGRVEPQERLYRGVPGYPQMWKAAEDWPSSALFKDSKGVSVDREGKRRPEEVVAALRTRLSVLEAVVTLRVHECIAVGAAVVRAPLCDNPFYTEIRRPEEIPAPSSALARRPALPAEIEAR
jgi:hypothetical protein